MAGDNGWTSRKVEDIKAEGKSALATGPFGSAISSKFFQDSGVPVIRGSNLSQDIGCRLNDDGLAFVSNEKAKEFQRSVARHGDIVFTCWGTIDQIGLIDERSRYDEYIVSNKQMKLTPDPKQANSLFLYYVFSSPEMRTRIVNEGIGSSVPGFNLGQLRNFELRLPPLPEQQAIVGILEALDDKIELNRRMNETLESMARAIFKSWFVDFDPVRAKMDGQEPPGMNPETAALFPDSLEEQDGEMIPKGWSMGTLDDVTEFVIGGDWGKETPQSDFTEPIFCVRGADIPSLQDSGLGKMPTRYIKGASLTKRALREGDLVFEISGGSPTQSTGRAVLVTRWLLDRLTLPLTCSNFCRLIRPQAEASSYFLYGLLRKMYDSDEFFQYENGTTGIKNLAFKVFSGQYTFCLPSKKITEAFDRLVASNYERMAQGGDESLTLANLRDTLLPKLLSGELRVPEAEKQVEEVA